MKRYIKNGQIKFRNQIVLHGTRTIKGKDGKEKVITTNIYNPTEGMILADGWVEYVAPTLTEEQLFNRAKSNKIRDIEYYDSSKKVNICYIKTPLDTIPYWADKTERSSLKSAVQDCISMNRETYRLDLRDANISVEVSCEKLL